jgi:hypothetical protein
VIRCLCGRTMRPVIFTQGKGWTCYYLCERHPGPFKPSTESFPLPASLAPPAIRLTS